MSILYRRHLSRQRQVAPALPPAESPVPEALSDDFEENVFDVSAVVVRGKPDESALIERIFSDDPELQMPPPPSGKKIASNKSLTIEEKQLIRRWVDEGARWDIHWAYAPPVRQATAEAVNPIDHFIALQLEESFMLVPIGNEALRN